MKRVNAYNGAKINRGMAMLRRLRVVYILPSRYDDDGYVLRHWRGVLPSNTLGVLRHLTESVARELDFDVAVETYDDTIGRLPMRKITHHRDHERIVVGLVGVQSNQFARATDIARELREAGVAVMVGGFHVSGVLAMFGEPSRELQALQEIGVTLVKGEAEAPGALAEILADAFHGRLRPIYDIKELPDLTDAPVPVADTKYLRHFTNRHMATLDTSRGCPFSCSFCCIINVQGQRMRCRSASSILAAIQRNYAKGIRSYFITDDNFSRSPVRDAVLDGMAVMRERGMNLEFMMQTDTRAHEIPGFVERARRAGCYMVFIGMETVNPANLESAGKRHNDVGDYRHMVDVWHAADVIVHVGYIIGFPYDTEDSVRADIDMLKRSVKVDVASFFMLTPAPGSRDHQRMVETGTPLDADLNNFDSLHETYRHPQMAPGAWKAAYHAAWHQMYDKENMVNVLLRTPRERYRTMFWTLVWYRFSALSGVHPMFAGHLRLKGRRDRRALFPRETIGAYAWRRGRELAELARLYVQLFVEFQEIWLLTRKRDDIRWSTLAELRTRWANVQERISASSLVESRETAARQLREMLTTSAERLRALSESRRDLSGRARRRMLELAQETENHLRNLSESVPSWQDVHLAQEYISTGLIARYEELAIRWVAKRRRFNEYRRDLVGRLKQGRFAIGDFVRLPMAVAFETWLALRFLYRLLTGTGRSTEGI